MRDDSTWNRKLDWLEHHLLIMDEEEPDNFEAIGQSVMGALRLAFDLLDRQKIDSDLGAALWELNDAITASRRYQRSEQP